MFLLYHTRVHVVFNAYAYIFFPAWHVFRINTGVAFAAYIPARNRRGRRTYDHHTIDDNIGFGCSMPTQWNDSQAQ